MVETARIDQHDRTMDTGVAAIALLIGAYWDNLNDSVNRLFDNPVTASGLRSALLNQLNRQDITVQIQTVLDDQLAMLGYEDTGYTVTRDQLSNTITSHKNNTTKMEESKKGLLLLLLSFVVVVHAASRQISDRKHSTEAQFGCSHAVAMELLFAMALAFYSTFSERFGAFGRFKEIREERGDVPGLTVTRMSDFSGFWTRAKAL